MPVSQADIGAKVGLDRTTVNKILSRYPNHNIPRRDRNLAIHVRIFAREPKKT